MPEKTAPNVAVWNIYFENSDANIRKGIDALMAAGADVILFNELSNDAKQAMVTKHLRSKGWDATTRNSAVTIGWNAAELKLIDKWHVVAFDNEPMEPGTAGTKTGLKIVMCIEVEHKVTKQRSFAFSTHLIPGAQSGTNWHPDKPKRRALVLRQATVLAKEMARCAATGNPVVGGGDMNVDFPSVAGRELEALFSKYALNVNWRAIDPDFDTHGSRTIDWIVYSNCTFEQQKTVGKHGSDHSTVAVFDLVANDVPTPDPQPEPTPTPAPKPRYKGEIDVSNLRRAFDTGDYSADALNLQKWLTRLNLKPGPVDGLVGPLTKAAWRKADVGAEVTMESVTKLRDKAKSPRKVVA